MIQITAEQSVLKINTESNGDYMAKVNVSYDLKHSYVLER